MSEGLKRADVRRRTIKISVTAAASALIIGALYIAAHTFWETSSVVRNEIPGERHPWKLEVVNTTGEAGLGLKVADYLRRLGYDVVDVRTQRTTAQMSTTFIDRAGAQAALTDLQTALELTPDRFKSELDRTLMLDVSIIVGSDIRSIPAFAAAVR